MDINKSLLKIPSYKISKLHQRSKKLIEKKIEKILINILMSERPVLITGSGIKCKIKKLIIKIRKKLNIPVAPTWASQEIWDIKKDQSTGSFGTHGTRSGNFAVQNSDFILSIGARLGTRETGHPLSSFARELK